MDNEGVKTWIDDNWPGIRAKYEPCDIFNADGTALFWQLLPSQTLVHRNEKCHGGKTNESRIAVVLMTSMDGSSKLHLLVVGKFKSPGCPRGCCPLPMTYTFNGKA